MKNNKKHPLTVFREANEARAKLVKKSMGGPGSGMGSMYLADQEFDAMMTPPSKPAVSNATIQKYSGMGAVDPKVAMAKASEQANMDRTKPKNKKGGSVKNKKR